MSAAGDGRLRATLERATFRTSRLLDFASDKELVAQIGHAKDEWPVVAVKELLDNAIDAAEEAGLAPVISVTLNDAGIAVQDNGPGIPGDVIEDIFDFGVRVSSRESYISPTRGAQGNALKTLVAMPFVLDGDRGRTVIETRGRRHVIDFGVDRIRQRPTVEHQEQAGDVTIGTRVTIEWPDSSRSILLAARSRFLQVAASYPWLNPHLSLTLDAGFAEPWTAPPATDPAWSKWRPSDPTSPHWYELQHFERLIAGYISHDADRGRMRTVREFIAEFRGLSSTAKQKGVLTATGLARAPLTALANGIDLDHDAAAHLLAALRASSTPVKPKMLGIIGRAHFEARFTAYGADMASFDYRRAMDTTDHLPWIIETAFAWIPKLKERLLITGVNWSPGIVNPFRQLGPRGQSLDTILSQQRADRDEPIALVLHMACPRVQFADRGKSAVVVR